MQLRALIDEAARVSGSYAELARTLGEPPTVISDWRHQRKTCSPENVALLAHVAGLDPADALIRAVLAKHQGTDKGARLENALGKRLRATGEVAISGIAALGFALIALMQPQPLEAATCYDV